ncbi:hypothetical protein [Roseibium sp.]|uniref:hypothetical protein n=1 Tax=Roseibium sp. TaxID=1936156 RepID=UPI00391B7482
MRSVFALVIMPVLWFSAVDAQSQSGPVAELTTGLWAEGVDLDPFGKRPVQLWLPEGSLIYDLGDTDRVSGTKARKYRIARTFHGYPVNLELFPTPGVSRYRRILSQNTQPRFRLLHSVYCAGETNPIVTSGNGCNFKQPIGEGWVFELTESKDTPLGLRYSATAYPDSKTIAELGPVDSGIYSFEIYERDLDLYEKQGVLFRLDRDHPLTSFHFIDEYFFPCNTTRTVEIKKEEIEKAFTEASVEADIGFWTWFKAKASAGVGFEDRGTSITSTKTQQDSSKASVFSQWGFMRGSNSPDVPFYVEKRFDCQSGVGTTKPGDWITSVEISFWNYDDDVNDVYEFDDAAEWVEMELDEIKKRHQRPVFFSVNDSDKQARVISNILKEYPELTYSQAVFVFAQLNNGCRQSFRDAFCDPASLVAAQ